MISSLILSLLTLAAPAPTQAPPVSASPASDASAPDPDARPSEGVFAVGSSGVAPLPEAPPPVSPSSIPRGSWRGQGWISLRLHGTGPLAGPTPARPTVVSIGGGAEAGWRIRQWVALGAGFARQPHEQVREEVFDAPTVISLRGYLTAWDIAFVRLYAPVRGRVDPFFDVGGGLAFYDPARDRAPQLGGTVRASVGFEAWVTRQMTLGLSGIYRMNLIDDSLGHSWQAAIDVGIHW